MTQTRKYNQSWLALEQAFGARPILKGSALEMRAQFGGLGEALASQYPPPSSAVRAVDQDIDGLKLRIYSPTACSNEVKLPVGVFAHGGGYVMGGLNSEDPLCRAIVEHANVIVVSVDYRLAPEHKSPAQLQDMSKALHWLYHNASDFHGDRSKIFAIGGSAGAGLALSVTRTVLLGHEDLPKDAVRGVLALAPVTLHPDNVPSSLQSQFLSYNENGENVPIIDKKSMDEFFLSIAVDPKDPSYFISLDQDILKIFPPVYVVTCEFDPLRDDGMILLSSLESNHVNVRHDHYSGLPHCFWLFPTLPETNIFMQNLFNAIGWLGEILESKRDT